MRSNGQCNRNEVKAILLLLVAVLALPWLQGCVGLTSARSASSDSATPLTIDPPAASNVTSSAATISWVTTLAATSQVDYGMTPSYGSQTTLNSTMVLNHSQVLSGLQAGQLYHYRVVSTDASNNQAVSPDFTFTTASSASTPSMPTVSIMSPAAGATVSATTTVSATASSSVGIASVQFQVDGSNVGSAVTASPYSFSLNTTTLSNATHTLTAVAKDTSNQSTTSAGVSVKVSNTVAPPTVSITAPAANATISGTATVSATATSSVGIASVQFQVDGSNVGSAVTASPYSFSWNTTTLSNGTHTLTAVAKDTSNQSTTSAGMSVKVSNTVAPPTVSITAPAANATVSNTVTVSATASSSMGVASVQFQVDGTNVGSAVTASPYGFSWNTTALSNGTHTLTAMATDTSNQSTTSAGVSVKVSNTVAPPTVSITAPAANATVSNTVTVSATASSSIGIASVQFQVDGSNVGSTVTTSPYSFSWNTTTLSNGTHTLTAVAKDTSNQSTASAGVSVTVSNAVTPPTVSITAPTAGATISGTVTLTASPSSSIGIASVQFQVDGSNVGSADTSSPYSYSLDTTTVINGSHTLTAVAKDTAGTSTTSTAVSVTVSNVVNTSMGPLVQSATNSHYFVNPAGQAVLLSGSQTWDDEQDTDLSSSPAAFDFTGYVNFLKAHGHNVTIVWHKDLPQYCNWGPGGTWTMGPFPWLRTGTGNASDGKPQFDLSQLDANYFSRLRARVVQLQQNGIYAIVELFDGLGLSNNRCAVDGYPFTGGNNVNGVDDGGGTNSMTMSGPNTITGYQDAYVKKVIDTLNDLPNVLWEVSEEAPDNSLWWEGHMISLIRSYEVTKPQQHPIGFPSLNVTSASDSTLYNSNADWVAPLARISPTSSCGSGTPKCKVNINDSDHSYYGMWNDTAQTNRNFEWENFTNGDSVMFMDPYLIYWPGSNRNLCSGVVNGVCSGVDTRWENFRENMGYILSYANTRMDLVKMTPQPNLCSTGYCLADNVAAGAEYLVYAPNGGSFTVNLSVTTKVLNVEWLDPSTGAKSSGGLVTGGSSAQSFTVPWGSSHDAVLYLVDVNGHN